MVTYKIDEVAKQSGLTKRTIRYYEEIGLLPSPQRSEGNIRLYTQEDVDLLKKIVSAKEVLGFSLQELQRYMSAAEMLKGQREEYRERTDHLQPAERRAMLVDMEITLNEQLEMMEEKINSIRMLQTELEKLRARVRERKALLDEELGSEPS
ncbi:MerR family transcriptional regulator [Paenibacillus brasilensis]|uniref:DNA-binding transcriptional MerR regulator n=1 Tax=Paenibacillus brasilensis TaxID=128574 RepID=A0ABU0L0R4_9BACL|nr:MerR family transcriptional regulator [Paenibacillus brasilensis]MDQ0495271.1 DNA-binding transcriptional MerR regulator [Paenibacillus brasilensis]